jgi:hypothetical protein
MDIKAIKREFADLRSDRATWDTMYQVLGEYVSQIKQNFTAEPTPGEFLVDNIFDSTGTFAAQNSASALLGMIWPGTARKTLEIAPPDDLPMDTELAAFYNKMTERTIVAFDDPAASLSLSFDEYMLDQIIFGTSGVGVEKGYKSKLLFRPYGVKEVYFEEGRNGIGDTLYIFFEWRINRVVKEYGIENVSENLRKKYKEGKSEKVKILHVIKERDEKKAEKGILAMPYMSLHIEFDTEHKLKESGFEELPIRMGRFRKITYERYGRSPAMSALPDIREANALREAIIRATEKMLDPPLGILDDGMLGGSIIDTSAGAVNVFNAAHNSSGREPVFPMVTIGSMDVAQRRLEELRESIAQHFFIDRLLDFNSQNEMTLGEVQIRDQIRTASLSALFSRQLAEVVTPVFERGVNILWREGEFGVLPNSEEEAAVIARGLEPEYIPDVLQERLAQGRDIYKIVYKTKAASAQRAEDYLAILELLGQYRNDIQLTPSIKNRVNLDEAYKQMASIRGIPVGVIRQDDAVAELNRQDQQAAQAAQMLAAGEQVANIADKAASAEQRAK